MTKRFNYALGPKSKLFKGFFFQFNKLYILLKNIIYSETKRYNENLLNKVFALSKRAKTKVKV